MIRALAGLLVSGAMGCGGGVPTQDTPTSPKGEKSSPAAAETETDAAKVIELVERHDGSYRRDEKLPGKPIVMVGLGGSKVTDAELKLLAPLKHLSKLYLMQTGLTDAGLKEVATLTGLTELNLHRTKITDAGLKELATLTSLTDLNLGSTRVNDVGLKELAPLKKLESLFLEGTGLTDTGLRELAPLTGLTTLYLGGTAVTDEGMKEVVTLKNLTTLSVGQTKISDAGLKTLTTLERLTLLYAQETAVSEGGVKQLERCVPKCKVIRWTSTAEVTQKRPTPATVLRPLRGLELESAGNDLLSPGKDYHRPQVLIVRVRDGNASFHLGKITGKLPDISVTTW